MSVSVSRPCSRRKDYSRPVSFISAGKTVGGGEEGEGEESDPDEEVGGINGRVYVCVCV